MTDISIEPGLYNTEYFSGAACAIYIGDVFCDEIVSLSYSVQHPKMPLYGYTDTLFRTVSRGQVIIQGQFTINFKEAGYLWLILNRYKDLQRKNTPLSPFNPQSNKPSAEINRANIEKIVTGNVDDLYYGTIDEDSKKANNARQKEVLSTLASYYSLTGFPGGGRSPDRNQGLGTAENIFEQFEDVVWGGGGDYNKYMKDVDFSSARRCDDPSLNGFDIYISYGDFAGDNRNNHSVQKLTDVHIIGDAQAIDLSPGNLVEQYSFICKNKI